MTKDRLNIGDLIVFTSKDMQGTAGIVSEPITAESPGHVLLIKDGCIIGMRASLEDIILADKSTQGFAQLAYNLIKLGSHVIEKRLL
jgi:hypothetical protein